MKALSVKQPWAELIAAGIKPIETRGQRTHYRGPLAIHASQRPDLEAARRLRPSLDERIHGVAVRCLFPLGDPLPFGRIVAIVNLTDCRPFTAADAEAACTPWRAGAYAWDLSDARRADSVLPVSGRLGIWDCPDGLVVDAAPPRIGGPAC